jgi:hypothetical protein
MLPGLVLRCWARGASEPVEMLDFHTLAGDSVSLDGLERFQVPHPLHLAEAGTLRAWQQRLVAEGRTQPFNQLFREYYTLSDAERARHRTERLGDRPARATTLITRLRKAGWRPDGWSSVDRRFPGRREARLLYSGGALYVASNEPLTVQGIEVYGPKWPAAGTVESLYFSEALRDVDLASAAAALDHTGNSVSRETLDARADLAQALVPEAEIDGDVARVAGYTLDLRSGAVRGPDGAAVLIEDPPLPPAFPYPSPEPATASVIARLVHLASGAAVANH